MEPRSVETVSWINPSYTKKEIELESFFYVSNILETGRILDAAKSIAQMEELLKQIKGNKDLKNAIRDEVAKYGKEYKSDTVKIELAEVGTKYDFSQCGDSELKDLYETLEQIKAKVEEREKFLKNLPLSGLDVITDDGEVVHVYPPSKSSTSSYKVTIAK
ncbi:hypothetical protein UFOVP153_19 [uncultured Caudovirales phage]|uniref:Uncharacterized protein n=1 Tax=uncultured Caudovirales phage TaxID=2100421 RepID=A0A6J7W8T3_9CAUD|nr:hypothetical protein UFOVP69_39 [uncultured Caudovirales phage]CAB5170413.1 hypothetical protein UFOVP153_19 [uncultured Caudovirales phage]